MSGVHQVLIAVFLLTTAVNVQAALPVRISPAVISETARSCPSNGTLESARSNISAAIQLAITFQTSPCGGLGWRQVANVNMSVASQQCPSPWVEISTPARSCISSITTAGCEGISLPVSGGSYSRVCGRAIGYAINSVDAFANNTGLGNGNIDNPYLDGVSVTYGSPRQHIWSFGAGHGTRIGGIFFRCPCDEPNRSNAPLPPSFVGDNYFCDGDYNGALWDGMDCTTGCCTFNSPPWFTASLSTPTSDDIEVRICADQEMDNEAVHVHLLQLFVQ